MEKNALTTGALSPIPFSLYAGVTQLVECNLAKVDVEGSSPFTRSPLMAVMGRLSTKDILRAIKAGEPSRLEAATFLSGLEILRALFESAKQRKMLSLPLKQQETPFVR